MFNVRLAGGHLYGKQLFTWLSLVVSLMASFVLSFFPLDVLDEIWDLIGSVSEGFLIYFSILYNNQCSKIMSICVEDPGKPHFPLYIGKSLVAWFAGLYIFFLSALKHK